MERKIPKSIFDRQAGVLVTLGIEKIPFGYSGVSVIFLSTAVEWYTIYLFNFLKINGKALFAMNFEPEII